jgi:hypothetical protein
MFIAAMSMPVMVGAAGLGTDTVQWYLWDRQLQQAADAAALAGAYAISQGGDKATAEQAALAELAKYPKLDLTETPDPELLATGTYANRAVEVELAVQRKLPFSGMLMDSTPRIAASATAAVFTKPGKDCIRTLGQDGAGIFIAGGSASMDCSVSTNSRHEQAALIDENFKVAAVSAVGGIVGTAAEGTKLNPFATAQDDPFAHLPPVTQSCPDNAAITKKEGTYSQGCYRGIKLTGSGKEAVNLLPGTYVIDGDVELGGNAELVGEGVTLILTKNHDLKIAGNPVIKLKAQTTGTYAGVIIYQDRNSTTRDDRHAGNSVYYNKFTGNSGSQFEGAIYMPAQSVEFQGNSNVAAQCLRIVAKSVVFNGSTTIGSTCPSHVPQFGDRVVRLVS